MPFDPQAHKAEILRHCLWMAQVDPEYAIWAAAQYEARNPVLLKNLEAKVRQEVRRSASQSRSAPSPGSTSGSTGEPAPPASRRSAK